MSTLAVPVVRLPREVTEASLPEFEALLGPCLQSAGPGIVLDLEGLEFISSAGLGILVRTGMRLDGQARRLAMARACRTVEKTIRLLGLDQKMPLYRSIDQAREFVVGATGPGRG
jgi:anti-sigma B factor antagonist